MSNILDNIQKIKKLDSKNMLGSLELLTEQIRQVEKTTKILKIKKDYKKVENVVVVGMGGSALGAHILKTLFKDELKVPVEIINDNTLPKYVNNRTLVIASSYSGTTEEVLNAVKDAKSKKAKLIGISSGGALTEWFKTNNLPILVFPVDNNPCGSPRMGLGYMIFGQIILLSKTGLIKFSSNELKNTLGTLKKYDQMFGIENLEENNLAKQIAKEALNRIVIYTASEHLLGNIHAASNQMNENAKRFATYFSIPELNHHLMEGMWFPKTNSKNLVFLLIESQLYDSRIQKRYEVTKNVLEKNKIRFIFYKCQAKTRLDQVCEILVLGSFISYYSAMLESIDPTAIPYVDFFKAELIK